MANGWTRERRARQALLIHQWKPWLQSTGPQTARGKVQASQNAYKGGMRAVLQALRQALRQQKDGMD